VSVAEWFLSRAERGNPATDVDDRHPDGRAWSIGNDVRALVHGKTYFGAVLAALNGTRSGDLVLFTDWRGDPDEQLDGPGTEIAAVLCGAIRRGVIVKGLVWRSHWEQLHFSARQNRRLADEVQAVGGEVLLDMRIRSGGSHHQKLFVVRHPGRVERDVAYVGGIDLCHGRNDDQRHAGDPQPSPMAPEYGDRPPWHDIQLEIRGPAVGDVETVFRERWNDPSELSRNPVRWLRDLVDRRDISADPLPEQLPDPSRLGTCAVQMLRTYPHRRKGYPFAPKGERSVARGYIKAVRKARQLIYIEDQYLWSAEVVRPFADALRENRSPHLIAVLPMHPDAPSRLAAAAQSLGRTQALERLQEAGGDRVALYGLENLAGTSIYVHAKACVIDDTWATVGSDNFNLRSWTYDTELTCAVYDDTAGGFARDLRFTLAREHLGRTDADDSDLRDPLAFFAAFAKAAQELDDWYDAGCAGPRPSGRLRRSQPPKIDRWRTLPAHLLYRLVCDPDGRPATLRRAHQF
jgi:phosphatidylserine/phosphatidylglycerophosphate/cardiolipin synthase-like enzyme